MTSKRPIDSQRESAASMDIGTDDDRSAIKNMFEIGGVLHIIKERGIYIVKLADKTDPKRTNPKIPNIQQRVLGHGSDSELVSRTLLTAQKLFNKNYLPKSFDHERALVLAFDALKDIVSMHKTSTDYQTAENSAVNHFTSQQRIQSSLVIPAISDLQSRCRTFIQKADHACGTLLMIVKLLYEDVRGGFEGLTEASERKYGQADPFTQFLITAVPFLIFIRETRNAIEHTKPDQKCIVTDFSLVPDGKILLPTIEVKYRRRQYPPESVAQFMARVSDQLPKVFEVMIAHMCSKHVQSFAGFAINVVELPESQRAEKHVRFTYGFYNGDQVVPAS